MMHSRSIFATLLVALAAAAGCGESESDKAMADVCSARDDITKQVDQLKDLTITTATTTEVTDGLQAIRSDLTKIADATDKLSDERREQVQAANDDFGRAVRETLTSLGTTTSLEDASAQLKQAFDDLSKSYQDTFGDLDC